MFGSIPIGCFIGPLLIVLGIFALVGSTLVSINHVAESDKWGVPENKKFRERALNWSVRGFVAIIVGFMISGLTLLGIIR